MCVSFPKVYIKIVYLTEETPDEFYNYPVTWYF